MPKNPGANLYKDAARWPLIPPWWLLSSPQAAALINVAPATVQYWKARGEGPPSIAPLFLKPAQGDPAFYMYGVMRSWAARRVGLDYSLEDQCHDYLQADYPRLLGGAGAMTARARFFDQEYQKARDWVRRGEDSGQISLSTVLRLDPYFAKQPVWRRTDAKYEWADLQPLQFAT